MYPKNQIEGIIVLFLIHFDYRENQKIINLIGVKLEGFQF